MDTKLMAYKMLIKFRKEEVSVKVVIAAAQCASGTMISSTLYLLNLFLNGCKDAQDLGTKFHYLWLLILITLIGWKDPPYSHFCEQIGRFHAVRYTSLGSTLDPKHRSGNTGAFAQYFI
jgi:hypothetical protein